MKEIVSRLTWVDYIALAAVLRGLYVGFKSGLFAELLRTLSYLAAFIVTFRYYELFAQYLTLNTFLNLTTATLVAFVGLIAGAFLLMKLLLLLLGKLLKAGQGNFIYKIFGAFAGACRWMVLLSLLFMVVDRSPLAQLKNDIQGRSLTGPKVAQVAPMLFDFLSQLSPQLMVTQKDL